MPVYVDNYQAPYRGMRMSHMIADTREELYAMVDRIGVNRRWLQAPNTYREHFDICESKRLLAIEAGAIELTVMQLGRKLAEKRGL